MVEQFFTHIVFTLLDISLKAILAGLLAIIIIRAFRHISVHTQHRIWTIVLLTLVFLPLPGIVGLSWSLPLSVWPNQIQLGIGSELPTTSSATRSHLDIPNPLSSVRSGGRESDVHGIDERDRFPQSPNLISAPSTIDFDTAENRTLLASESTAAVVDPSPSRLSDATRSSKSNSWSTVFPIVATIWLIGVGAMLLRLLFAVQRVRRLMQRSFVISDLSRPGELVYESDQIESPVVVGWWQPSILLPRSWRNWTAGKFDAVFSHELSHLRRHDTLVSFLAEIATIFYWFHPVSWLTKQRLSQLAELACDEAAAVATGNRLEYARHLVEIAAANRRPSRHRIGTAMARSSEIGQRVRVLLDPSRPLTGRISFVSFALILLMGLPAAGLLSFVQPTSIASAQPPVTTNAAQSSGDVASTDKQDSGKLPARATPADAPFAEDAGYILTMRGSVHLPDGSLVKDAILERGQSDVVSATISDGEFEIRLAGTKLNNPSILVRTTDWKWQTSLMLKGHTLRQECVASQRLVLSPTRAIQVQINEGAEPVANAHVQINAGSFNYLGTSNARGIAEFLIPRDESVFLMSAWTDDHRAGGVHAARNPTRDQFGEHLKIEVSRGDPVRVRAINDQQRPVPNVLLSFVAVDGQHGEAFVGDNPTTTQMTNAEGDATFAWVPAWAKERVYFGVVDRDHWRMVGERSRLKSPDGTYQIQVAPSKRSERVLIQGRTSGVTGNLAGLLVEFWSFDGEQEHESDVVYSRTDADGQFAARVLPDARYSVFVNDRDLVSNVWHDAIALSKESMIRQPELVLTTGVPVEIQITQGDDRHPMKNAWVHLESPHPSNQGRRFWGKTDENGHYSAPVSPGTLEIRASDGDWEMTKTVEIIEGKPLNVHLHRKFTTGQPIHGRLILPEGTTADLHRASVRICSIDGESKDETTVFTDEQGHFTASIMSNRISVFAASAGETHFGCVIMDVSSESIDLPIEPTVVYQGIVLDQDKRPVPNVEVYMDARLTDENPNTERKARFERRYKDYFERRKATTNANGEFSFPSTPQNIELMMWFMLPGANESSLWEHRYLTPDETRPREVFHLASTSKTSAVAPAPLAPLMSRLLQNCRVTGIHALVIVSGDGEMTGPFIKNHLSDQDDASDIDSYLPKQISSSERHERPEDLEFFQTMKWPFPKKDSLFLVALRGNSDELGRLQIDLADDQKAAHEVKQFLKAHLPLQLDAKAGFESAMAEARKSGRRVWVRVSQTRCGPCYALSRWLDSQKDLLEKDYVLYKFDDVRDLNGADLSVALNFDTHGVPCHAILDTDGRELANSIGPLGNIGDPSGSIEGKRHLKMMLKTTAKRLTDAEIEILLRSMPDD